MEGAPGAALRDAAARLRDVTDSPRLDAELLLAHSLGISRSTLLSRLHIPAPLDGFEALLARRLNHEPVAYITGGRGFYNLDFITRPPVLIPRPETEHLVEAALAHLKQWRGERPPRILDLCTGSGCVAITLACEIPGAKVSATDIGQEALALADENNRLHKAKVRLLRGDLFDALPKDEPPFDVIVSNPPYVETGEWAGLTPDIRLYEDTRALLAGEDGLDLIRRIIPEALPRLSPGGLLALEMGEKHHLKVAELMTACGYKGVRHVKDLAGIPRIALGLK